LSATTSTAARESTTYPRSPSGSPSPFLSTPPASRTSRSKDRSTTCTAQHLELDVSTPRWPRASTAAPTRLTDTSPDPKALQATLRRRVSEAKANTLEVPELEVRVSTQEDQELEARVSTLEDLGLEAKVSTQEDQE